MKATLRSIANKFHAQKTTHDGITFDSKKEAAYYSKLQYLKHAHELRDRVTLVETQVHFPIKINNKHCFSYFLDFQVHYGDGHIEYVDVKGLRKGSAYQVFRLKKTCVEAEYDIEIKEV